MADPRITIKLEESEIEDIRTHLGLSNKSEAVRFALQYYRRKEMLDNAVIGQMTRNLVFSDAIIHSEPAGSPA